MTIAAAEESPSARKKAKLDEDEGSLLSPSELAATAWHVYRTYLESLDEEEEEDTKNGGAIKELCGLLRGSKISHFDGDLAAIRTEADMLPILASVVYYQLASTAISTYLSMSNANDDNETCKEETIRMRQQAQRYMQKSLDYYPANAATWSMGANFGRITFTLLPSSIVEWYQQAAEHASRVRRETIVLLETGDYGDDSEVKEWMELLLLQQVVGVEYVVEDDDDDNDEGKGDDQDNEDGEEGYFSASSIEGTARYMAAMLLSRGGDHALALRHIQEFPLTHRLHPRVWIGATAAGLVTTAASSPIVPVSFQGGVLPPKLYQRMCEVFAPDAVYWKESDYGQRGYYSFFADIDNDRPTNLIHDVVVNHLLPLVKQVLSSNGETTSEIVAYEWWAHSREFQANLGHTLHFDTDECILAKEEDMHHPILSSVLHITGDSRSGATIVLDQTPQSESVADQKCWRSVPRENTFMVFPGNLLHGVLPCPGITASNSDDAAKQEQPSQWVKPTTTSNCPHRLTFMVGFKTRRVPDQRKEQNLYGPCGPLPPNTVEWVKEIRRGYESANGMTNTALPREPRQESIRVEELPSVSPAWECLPEAPTNKAEGGEPPLELPTSIDHRFFVKGAPQCFRESIFDECD